MSAIVVAVNSGSMGCVVGVREVLIVEVEQANAQNARILSRQIQQRLGPEEIVGARKVGTLFRYK